MAVTVGTKTGGQIKIKILRFCSLLHVEDNIVEEPRVRGGKCTVLIEFNN